MNSFSGFGTSFMSTSSDEEESNVTPVGNNQTTEANPSSKEFRVVTGTSLTQVTLSYPVTYDGILNLQTYIIQLSNETKTDIDRYNYIRDDALFNIEFILFSAKIKADHRDWTNDIFFSHLKNLYSNKSTNTGISEEAFIQKFKEVKMNFNLKEGIHSLNSYVNQLRTLINNMNSFKVYFTNNNEKSTIEGIIDNIPKNPLHLRLKNKILTMGKPSSITVYIKNLADAAGNIISHFDEVEQCGISVRNISIHDVDKKDKLNNNNYSNNKRKFNTDINKSNNNNNSVTNYCDGCGGNNHSRLICRFKNHPDFNKDTTISWINSEKGKAWKNIRGLDRLAWHVDSIDGTVKGKPRVTDNTNSKRPINTNKNHKRQKREYCYIISNENTNFINYNNDDNNSNYVNSLIPTEIIYNNQNKLIETLLDTGSLQANYISRELADWLKNNGAIVCHCNSKVCDVFGICKTINESFNIDIILKNEITNQILKINIFTRVITSDYDLIIGLPTIKKYNLINHFSYKFIADAKLDVLPSSIGDIPQSHELKSITELFVLKGAAMQIGEIKPKRMLLDIEPDADDLIDEFRNQSLWDTTINSEFNLSDIQIEGSDSMKNSIANLIIEFKDIFSSSLENTPALLPPMELKVDEAKWKVNSNAMAPRIQSLIKEEEIEKQTTKLRENNKIQSCLEPYYSQVHLTKPLNKSTYRFCIDYRNLNNCTENIFWPLPNIDNMLRRLGTKSPKYFAKIDMTSGYHQIGIHENSRSYTAFITYLGIFTWLCIPFGLKGAPAYFQKLISTIVLLGLIYIIVELYIDDIIIHGQSENEFLINIRLVFERFRQYKLKLSPKKCIFGVTEVEYVGRIINHEGITFSKRKKEFVVNFIKPKTQKELKSFLGIATYFCTHIKNYSDLTKPLRDMILEYKPKTQLSWNDHTNETFQNVKSAINNCPTLYFIKPNLPVFLHTDASDYGIGAYLFQLDGDVEYPIAFISKSLTPPERKWAVPDKEAFSIFFSLMKLEFLLRDIFFTLRTDHANLTYINLDYKGRVKRWKLAIQEFTFDIQHIKGKNNFIADAFSRMIEIDSPSNEEQSERLQLLIIEEFKIPTDKYKLIQSVHNNLSGHHGIDRTEKKLKSQNIKWKYMHQHIMKFIKLCPCCQKMSFLKLPISANKFISSTYNIWERANIDTIGPLPIDEYGNKYIVVIIDCFSRFVMLYPTQDASAKSAAQSLIHCIGMFGTPSQLLSDNGPQYVNSIIDELLYVLGTEHQLTLTYSHEENSIVERANKEINRHLRALIFHQNVITRWSLSLPLVQRIFNAEIKESLGVSPAQIIFGNAINLDRGIILPHSNSITRETALSNWISNMLQIQHDIISAAKETQWIINQSHLENNPSITTQFDINSYVLVEYDDKPPTKLNTNLKGPLRVVNSNGNIYTLQNLVTEKNEDHHISKIRPFYYDPSQTDPILIANKDQQMVNVDSILDMKGNPHQSRSNLYFKVRWRGCTEREDTWEPYSNLRHNSKLHEFLIRNKLRKLIPK